MQIADGACVHIERAMAETTNDAARDLLAAALDECRKSGGGGVTTQSGGGGTTNPTDPKPPSKN